MQFDQTTGEAGTIENFVQQTVRSGGEIMTVEECATFTRTSVSYWRKKIAANALPVLRLGRRTLLRKSDILTYLESRVCASSDDLRDRAQELAATVRVRSSRHGGRAA